MQQGTHHFHLSAGLFLLRVKWCEEGAIHLNTAHTTAQISENALPYQSHKKKSNSLEMSSTAEQTHCKHIQLWKSILTEENDLDIDRLRCAFVIITS